MPVCSGVVSTYQNLMDTLSSGLLLLDKQSNVCNANRWFNRHCEYEMASKVSQNLYSLFPELKNTRIQDAIDSAIELGYPSVISNVFNPSPFPLYSPQNFNEDYVEGKRILQQVTISQLQHDGEIYCLIHINDVSAAVARERILETEIADRKHIEDALLESDIKHLTIMENMVDGLIIFDQFGLIESFNPASEKLFAYAESSIIGMNVAILFDGLTEDAETTLNEPNNAITIKKKFIGSYCEIKAVRCDGKTLDVELSVSKMQIAGKTFFTAFVHDISERKIVDKMKTEFISTVSHELRTPLTSIRGSLGLITGGIIELSSDKALELVNIAYSNCDRLVLLINDILDMEKIANGGLSLEMKQHDLRALIQRCIDDNQSYADAFKVNYVLEAPEQAFNCNVDSHRFLQIIANLLSNAAKFSNQGDNVDVRLLRKKNNIEIQIQDYGEGIPDAFKESIWNKFTQADASTTRKKGGTGLGLAISRSLVTSMGGEIHFSSELGKGTTFFVTFAACH